MHIIGLCVANLNFHLGSFDTFTFKSNVFFQKWKAIIQDSYLVSSIYK